MTESTITNRDLLATAWTWAGDAAPARGDELSPIDMTERLNAIGRTGWEGIGITHADLVKTRDAIGLRAFRQLIDDAGIRHVELEFLSNWWTDGELRAKSDVVRNDLFRAAGELGVKTIKVGAQLTSFGVKSPVEPERFAEQLDALATDAARYGVRVAVEPMPMSNLPTVADGVNLITTIGNPNAGLVVDTWHVGRAGTPYATLPEILPIDSVFIVELDDADADVVGSLWDDTVDRRRLPGDGALDTAAFVKAMHQAGWTGHWGVEIISAEHRARALDAALVETREKTLAAIDAAERQLG
jgi:Sugar phosphate isomerases/epimerases